MNAKFCFQSLLTLVMLSSTWACTLTPFGTDQIIERSKEEAPDWMAADEGKREYFAFGDGFTMVMSRSRILNFPIGAKETQVESLALSEVALTDFVKKNLQRIEAEHSIVVENRESLHSICKKVVAEVHAVYAAVADLYFQKRVDRSGDEPVEYYEIYVRVVFSSHGMSMVQQRLGTELRKTGFADLKTMADHVLPLGDDKSNTLFSH